MLRKSRFWATLLSVTAGAVLTAATAQAGVFGTVVPIGGEGADLALDEARGFLYIADFTANRIDVMSLATNQVQTSINVPAQPSSLSISQDGHWLLVSEYGNNTAPATQQSGLTLIDLTNHYAQQTYALGNAPLGVSFGVDGNALVVTTGAFLVFSPTQGTITTLLTISQAAAQTIPVPAVNFPPNVTGASLAVSADYTAIYGLASSVGGQSLSFYYNVVDHTVHGQQYTSSPPQGPVAVSVARDGSYAVMGWIRVNQALQDTAEFPLPSGVLNVGGHALDSANNVVYSQVPQSGATSNGQGVTPLLQVLSSDNLTVLDSILLPENLAGKAVLKNDSSVVYALSSSGVTVLPVGSLNKYPRLTTSSQSILFLDNYCSRNATTQTFTISDPGGNHTAFSISSSSAGVTVSPSSGVTPAVIQVSVDPNAFQNQNGTSLVVLSISSAQAIDIPSAVTVLVNAPQPSQRGTIVPIPGTLVDLLSDNSRVRYYVLRQDANQVLVFNGTNNTQIATLRTCTQPTSMAETFDGNKLLVGCNLAHIMSVFDLNALQPLASIDTGSGYVQSVAVSNGLNLAVMRDGGGGPPFIASVDLVLNQAPELPTLGVYQNKVLLNTVLASSPNGSTILLASADGHTMLYDANVNSFTASRQDFTSLGGPYAASAFGQYVVGPNVFNSSLAPTGAAFSTATETGTPSGFVFVNQTGYLTTAANSTSPGVVQNVNLSTGGSVQPTSMVEAPLVAIQPNSVAGTNCSTSVTTNANGSQTSVQSCTTGLVTTIIVCTASTGSSGTTTTTTNNCTTKQLTATGPTNAFTRTLAMLQDGSAFINLTTSGVTVLPPTYAASVAPPQITSVVSAADFKSPAAPGGLITVFGTALSPTNQATSQIPVPTALASSCLTVNGEPMPLIFVSPTQVNAQMPFQAVGNVVMVVHTPGGVSPNFNLTVQPTAPAVFLSGSAGPLTNLPTVVRQSTNLLVSDSNPVHLGDMLVIYLTGMGAVSPLVPNGTPGPQNPPANAINPPVVTLGGANLSVEYAGLAPGEVGVYQINAVVPPNAPQGLSIPLIVNQGGLTETINNLRVVQ
jgi:uncharacterized protein (TIGR03437 family)